MTEPWFQVKFWRRRQRVPKRDFVGEASLILARVTALTREADLVAAQPPSYATLARLKEIQAECRDGRDTLQRIHAEQIAASNSHPRQTDA